MSQTPDDDRVETRAELLPEEEVAGSDDPEAQAEAILEESDERTEDSEGTREAVDPDAGLTVRRSDRCRSGGCVLMSNCAAPRRPSRRDQRTASTAVSRCGSNTSRVESDPGPETSVTDRRRRRSKPPRWCSRYHRVRVSRHLTVV